MTQYTYGLTQVLGHGHAFTEDVVVPTPAAGAGFTYAVGGLYWQLLDSVSFQVVTSSQAANRQPTLSIKDASGVALATLPSASVQTATLTWQYTYSPAFSHFNTVVALAVTAPLPRIFLQPGYSLALAIGAVDTADQVSNIRLQVEQFVTGPQGYLIGVADADGARLSRGVPVTEDLA